MSQKPLILITNDDGIEAPGIGAVAEALADVGEVFVVAPDRERSAASHAISLDRPLRVEEVAKNRFAVDGTPADCVYLAMLHLCPRKPDLCVSGINNGFNLGSDVFYSGTVAGALEAALRGTFSIAVSLERRTPQDFSQAAAFTEALAHEAILRGPDALPKARLLSVNVPGGTLKGYQVTSLGRRVYRETVEVRRDLRGRAYYWIGGPETDVQDVPGSDSEAVRRGFASVTPLGLDLTHTGFLGELARWQVRGFVRDAVHDAQDLAQQLAERPAER